MLSNCERKVRKYVKKGVSGLSFSTILASTWKV
jgi:hypothetical protein